MDTIDVLLPGKFSPIRAALATCAIEGNQFAIDALETIRRVEANEPVGEAYVKKLNKWLLKGTGLQNIYDVNCSVKECTHIGLSQSFSSPAVPGKEEKSG